jgi:hypothetical protein
MRFMTNLMNGFAGLLGVSALVLCFSGSGAAARPQRMNVPMTPDRWETLGAAEFKPYKGVQALVLGQGGAFLKDFTFRNGTVEFDVEPVSMGAGAGFRMRDMDNVEYFYFRPTSTCAQAADCIQYTPVSKGVMLWDVFPQYQSAAPVRLNEWNHVKLVVSGQRMNVFINRATSPTLQIGRLEGDVLEGRLALIGPGSFANLTVLPDAVERLAPEPAADPTARDNRFVRHWQISPASAFAEGAEPDVADLSKSSTSWQKVAAERGGLINISRLYGKSLAPPARSLTWLKTTISSTTSQSKTAAIGWTREIWVFVNGRRVYTDKNLYQPPSARKPPDGRLSLQNGSFVLPLKAGDNEVAVAIANNFYGWGLMLHLNDLNGVHLASE